MGQYVGKAGLGTLVQFSVHRHGIGGPDGGLHG